MEFIKTLRPYSNALALLGHHNTGPFGFLNSAEPCVSMSNYYLETMLLHLDYQHKQLCVTEHT